MTTSIKSEAQKLQNGLTNKVSYKADVQNKEKEESEYAKTQRKSQNLSNIRISLLKS